MPTVLLVRHGQASFGGADYDVLSPLGARQSDVVAAELVARGLTVGRLITGSLRRQCDTAAPLAAALGLTAGVDPRFDEYSMEAILADHSSTRARPSRPPGSDQPEISSAAFQDLLEQALSAWIAAGDAGPPETWPAFVRRVRDGLRDAAAGLTSGSTAVVFTSGGVIAATATMLWELPEQALITLNRVAVNTAITKIVTGRSGVTLVSFNEHGHLEHGAEPLVSYR
ncbi:MAG: histidine phosphatase family protein [Solirubrobacteraceae bacterium]|jgi:broad specificity phosphatase PhoE